MIHYHAFARLCAEFITGILAYIITISPVGYFRAGVAKKMGDTSAEEQGFLTLNPLAHVSIVGILLVFSLSKGLRSMNLITGPVTEFIFFGFLVVLCVLLGIGTIRLPIFDPARYCEPYRKLKLALVSFSGFFAYMLLGILALIILVVAIGKSALVHATSFSLAMVTLTGIQMCAIFGMFDLFIYGTFLLLYHYGEDQMNDLQTSYFTISLIAMGLIMFFGDYISNLLLYGISFAAQCIIMLIK